MQASCLVQRQKTPDRRPNISRPYIKVKVYGQTVWLDGGAMDWGAMAELAPWIRQWLQYTQLMNIAYAVLVKSCLLSVIYVCVFLYILCLIRARL